MAGEGLPEDDRSVDRAFGASMLLPALLYGATYWYPLHPYTALHCLPVPAFSHLRFVACLPEGRDITCVDRLYAYLYKRCVPKWLWVACSACWSGFFVGVVQLYLQPPGVPCTAP